MIDRLYEVVVNAVGSENMDATLITAVEAAYTHAIGTNAVADYLLHEAHQAGYDDGYTDGYDAGYEDGTVENYRGPGIYTNRSDV